MEGNGGSLFFCVDLGSSVHHLCGDRHQYGIFRSMSGSNMVTTPAAWNKSLRRRSMMLASHMRARSYP